MGNHKASALPTHGSVFLSKDSVLQKIPVPLMGFGVVCLVIAFLASKSHVADFFFSYHVGFIYFLSLALGCLFFVLIQFAAKVGWSVIVRRYAELVAGSIPVFLILFIPVILGMHTLFHHWTDAEAVAKDVILQRKAPYLNEPFFYIRAVIYFGAWLFMSWFFKKNSLAQDASGNENFTYKMQNFSYPAIAIFAVTTTFASIDWIKSINPHWPSTMFGVYFFAGCIMSAYALLTLLGNGISENKYFNKEHNHDLGKLLFAQTVFWAYIAFSQYFLIWYGNIPEETLWFEARMHGGWMPVSAFLAVGHFVLPFLFMIPRESKRNQTRVVIAAAWMLFMHLVDIYWLIMPSHQPEGPVIDLTLILSLIGVGSIFFGTVFKSMGRCSIVPVGDPRLSESVAFENF